MSTKIDPITGIEYNMNGNLSIEPEVLERLTYQAENLTRDRIGKRWEIWNDFQIKVEESFHDNVIKYNTADNSAQEVTSQICEIIQDPIFNV